MGKETKQEGPGKIRIVKTLGDNGGWKGKMELRQNPGKEHYLFYIIIYLFYIII